MHKIIISDGDHSGDRSARARGPIPVRVTGPRRLRNSCLSCLIPCVVTSEECL